LHAKPESFIKGALILSLATLVSRVLGAIYKPIVNALFAPYDGMGGERGMGLAQIPYQAYGVILSFTAVGLNVGISKLIAERLAVRDAEGARRVFRYSFYTMGGLGLAGALFFWFGAPYIAAAIGENALEAIPGFRATAPALFFVSLMGAYRGLFQGFQQMTPNAVSQLIEQVTRIGTGVFLVWLLAPREVALGAAGFNFGDVAGAVTGLIYLAWLAARVRRNMWGEGALPAPAAGRAGGAPPDVGAAGADVASPWPLMRRVIAVSMPIAVIGAILPFMGLADAFIVLKRLAEMGLEAARTQAAFGRLTNSLVIVSLPSVFTLGLYTSLVPAMAESMAQANSAQIRSRAQTAYRMTALLALPAQVGLFVLADGAYLLLFPEGAGGHVLAAMSWAVTVMMLQQTSSGILQGVGKVGIPVRNLLIALLVKTGLTYLLVGITDERGAALATAAAFLVAALLNLWEVERLVGRTLDLAGMFLRPAIAALAMGAVLWVMREALGPASNRQLVTLGLVALGGAVYLIVLLVAGGIREEDLRRLPRIGEALVRTLRRLRLLRSPQRGGADR
jgi:stage V sporulation protein B